LAVGKGQIGGKHWAIKNAFLTRQAAHAGSMQEVLKGKKTSRKLNPIYFLMRRLSVIAITLAERLYVF
jgi:hypothetical protein